MRRVVYPQDEDRGRGTMRPLTPDIQTWQYNLSWKLWKPRSIWSHVLRDTMQIRQHKDNERCLKQTIRGALEETKGVDDGLE